MTMTTRFYSQSDEQEKILWAVDRAGLSTGRFLDIGAWDGETFSNCRALAERGWAGVHVEPSPGPARRLLDLYGESKQHVVVLAALGLVDGPIEMWLTDDGLSTTDEKHRTKWDAVANYRRALAMQITWDSLLSSVDSCEKGFSVVSIDTEGTSTKALFTMPDRIRPVVMVVELDDGANRGTVMREFSRRGYALAHETPDNMIGMLK